MPTIFVEEHEGNGNRMQIFTQFVCHAVDIHLDVSRVELIVLDIPEASGSILFVMEDIMIRMLKYIDARPYFQIL
jgi:hypothetical protein